MGMPTDRSVSSSGGFVPFLVKPPKFGNTKSVQPDGPALSELNDALAKAGVECDPYRAAFLAAQALLAKTQGISGQANKPTPDAQALQALMKKAQVEQLENDWQNNERWHGIQRDYDAEDVVRLRNSFSAEPVLARLGAERLWTLLQNEDFIPMMGTPSGTEAVQLVNAGLKGIHLSGWETAARKGAMRPDLGLYGPDTVPSAVKNVNDSLLTAAQAQTLQQGDNNTYWPVPIMADGDAGFGGPKNCFDLMQKMIEAGAAAVHLEDQLVSEKRCGHMPGKVLVPTRQAVENLKAARLAADIAETPTLIVARTDAATGKFVTSDIDPRDQKFLSEERTPEGYYRVKEGKGLETAIERGLAYAPYADIIWFEPTGPDLGEAKKFADAIHAKFPGKLLGYNASASMDWTKLDPETLEKFQRELGKSGFKLQTLSMSGYHVSSLATHEMASDFLNRGMAAYADLQRRENSREGYTATTARQFEQTGVAGPQTVAEIVGRNAKAD